MNCIKSQVRHKKKTGDRELSGDEGKKNIKNSDSSDSESSPEAHYFTHYDDQALIMQLKRDESDEDDQLFDSDESHDIWRELSSAKDRIDTYLLSNRSFGLDRKLYS